MRLPQIAGFVHRLRVQEDAHGSVVPRWVPFFFAACAVVLVPWAVLLAIVLPERHVAQNWGLAWGGLDIVMAAGLVFTATAVLRRSVWTPVAATMTATLLVMDAWFDVTTASGAGERWVSVGMAVFCELPLATLCVLVARNVERVLEQARRCALAAGYRVQGRDLVAPD